MTDIMIDLETLSTQPDAAIISIGAVVFDIKTGALSDTLYKTVGLFSQQHYGHISPETVAWWLQQSDAARQDVINIESNQYLYALNHVRQFIRRHSDEKTKLWSNGSSFDLVILRNAFQRHGMKVVWQYWQERDVRTIVDLARDITGIDPKQQIEFVGTEHNALDDAIHQAKYVSKAYQLLQTGVRT